MEETIEARRSRLQCARIERQEAETRNFSYILTFSIMRSWKQDKDGQPEKCKQSPPHHVLSCFAVLQVPLLSVFAINSQ